MKTNQQIILSILVFLFFTSSVQAQQRQQGLLQRLIEIKYSSELYLTTTLKNDKLDQSSKDSAMAIYNTMRWKIDGWVYQLSSDLITENSPRKFKQINTHFPTSKKSIENYVVDLKQIDALYKEKIEPKLYNQPRTLNLTTNVFYLIKDSYSIIKGLSDLKTRKTMAIVELLDHIRLLPVGELMKGGK